MTDPRDRRPSDEGDAPRLDPETLAALMEGRLADNERARVLEILAESEPDLEILADAAVAHAALDDADTTGTVELPTTRAAPPAPRFPAGRWLAVAAVLVGLVSIPLLLRSPGGADVSADLVPLRTALADVTPFAVGDPLPPTVGGEVFRSEATGELLDSLPATARSFRRGALWARLSVLDPTRRRGSQPDSALRRLLLGSGAAAQPRLEGWLAESTDSSWLAAAEALASVETGAAAFRLGMSAERISLGLARDRTSPPTDPATRAALTSAFDDLPAADRDRLTTPFQGVLDALDANPPNPAALERAVRALGTAVMELPAGLRP